MFSSLTPSPLSPSDKADARTLPMPEVSEKAAAVAVTVCVAAVGGLRLALPAGNRWLRPPNWLWLPPAEGEASAAPKGL